MYATPPGVSIAPHFSHALFNSNAISFSFLLNDFSKLSHLEQKMRNIAERDGLPSYLHHHDAQTCRVYYSRRAASDFSSGASDRRGTRGTGEIASGAGRRPALRDRYTWWRSLNAAASGRRLSRWLLSKTEFPADETDRAKRLGFCSAASASASRHKSGIPQPRRYVSQHFFVLTSETVRSGPLSAGGETYPVRGF